MLKIGRSCDRFIFSMGIPLPGKTVFILNFFSMGIPLPGKTVFILRRDRVLYQPREPTLFGNKRGRCRILF